MPSCCCESALLPPPASALGPLPASALAAAVVSPLRTPAAVPASTVASPAMADAGCRRAQSSSGVGRRRSSGAWAAASGSAPSCRAAWTLQVVTVADQYQLLWTAAGKQHLRAMPSWLSTPVIPCLLSGQHTQTGSLVRACVRCPGHAHNNHRKLVAMRICCSRGQAAPPP